MEGEGGRGGGRRGGRGWGAIEGGCINYVFIP